MKILVVSHTYIVPLNCEKFRILAQLESNIEVAVVVPKRWRPGGVQNQVIETKAWKDKQFQVTPITNFSQNNQGLLTFGWDIITFLQEFKPQIIQVEQGVKSLAYAQLITLNKFLGLQAKNLFFTWWNLPYQSKFPISWLEHYNLQQTDGLIAGNQDAANILREHGYQGVVKVMPQLGVDETLFSACPQPELKNKLEIKSNEFIIGYIGRFVPEKGILTLLKAVAKLSNYPYKLLLLGRGELKEAILKEAKTLGIEDRLILIESVSHDCVPRYINIMNVLVLPSETTYQFKTLTAVGWKEQFGHVLIEAMACKVPVIGSDSGEIPNVIGEAGLIFPEGNVNALKDCLQQVIENSTRTKNMAEKGYQLVHKKYTNKALARELLDFYLNLSEV